MVVALEGGRGNDAQWKINFNARNFNHRLGNSWRCSGSRLVVKGSGVHELCVFKVKNVKKADF